MCGPSVPFITSNRPFFHGDKSFSWMHGCPTKESISQLALLRGVGPRDWVLASRRGAGVSNFQGIPATSSALARVQA